MSRARQFLTPRVLAPVMLWTLSLWLIHTYLFELPVFSVSLWRSPSSDEAASARLPPEFPSPMDREGEDWLDSVDPRRRPFSPHNPPKDPFPKLRPTRFLPDRCLVTWFMDGETTCGSVELGPEDTLDATWLWVNGSDTRWVDEMRHFREAMGVKSPSRHFREQNELVYSMRSVLDNLKGHVGTVHLILYDYAFNSSLGDLGLLPQSTIDALELAIERPGPVYSSGNREKSLELDDRTVSDRVLVHLNERWRVAQTPTWLDFARRDTRSPQHPVHPATGSETALEHAHLQVPYPTFRYAGHSEIFHLPTSEQKSAALQLGEKEWREREWRGKALPTYNSMAIESRISWLPGLSDVSIALNDDFFMMRPHAVSDFHSPLYGNVIRFKTLWYQWIKPDLDDGHISDAGEMGGLYHANWLLSKRFPKRKRPYFAHAPKVITRGLHQEASLMFREALTLSSTRRFRELKIGNGDVQIQWLLTQLRVERWREGLLWTYVVANLGGAGGIWNDASRQALVDLFGLGAGAAQISEVEVYRIKRKTLDKARMERNFEQAGWEAPKRTSFDFTSLDGHFPGLLPKGTDPKERDRCILDFDRCFGSFWTRGTQVSASEMLKRLAFQESDCGDCLIMALVTASGPLGLSALFPPAAATYTNPSSDPAPHFLPPPHLPLDPTWQSVDFSLANVMSTTSLPGETINLRLYCMKLLSRYIYSSGNSDVHFHMLKNAEGVRKSLKQIDDSGSVAILGLNDDIVKDYSDIRALLSEWFHKKWPTPAIWERAWST